MRVDAFVVPGQGSSDALLDWLQIHEIPARIHDLREDESAVAEAFALGAGRLPVLKRGERSAAGFDPQALLSVLQEGEAVGGGLKVEFDGGGQAVVAQVESDSAAESAGLQPGDVIAELGGYSAFTVDQLRTVLSWPARRPVQLRVKRSGELLELNFLVTDLRHAA